MWVYGRKKERKIDRKKERGGGGKGDSPAMAGRGMPGPGTGERDGGWSTLTSLLPNREHSHSRVMETF